MGHFLTALKVSKTQEKPHGYLTTLKVFNIEKRTPSLSSDYKVNNAQKGLHNFLTTLSVFNSEKRLHDFFTTLKVFNIERGFHHLLEALIKGLNFEKWLHHILTTPKVFQNNYSVECWWKAASESRLSYHIFINELGLLSVSNLIALGIYFLFGIKFSWDEGTVIWFNVKCV